MFAELATYPLPPKPGYTSQAPQRRHYAGPIDLHGAAFFAFLHVAEELIQAPLELNVLNADQLACDARWLLERYAPQRQAPCVKVRMHVVAALRALRTESNWELPPEPAALVRRLLAYHDSPEHVIPVRLPVLGHLDDAILLEAIWPCIRDDVHEYMDFRRLRRLEAELCGVTPSRLPYTHQDWYASHEAEHKLREQFRRNARGRYTSGVSEAPRFTVH